MRLSAIGRPFSREVERHRWEFPLYPDNSLRLLRLLGYNDLQVARLVRCQVLPLASMKRSARWSDQWIYYLTASFFLVAVFLRSILTYQDSPELGRVLGLLLVFVALLASEPAISARWSRYFIIYMAMQTALIFALLALPDHWDFFAALFFVPSMQVMTHLKPRHGALWMGLFALITVLSLAGSSGAQAIALTLIYIAGCVFFGSYALTTRRAQAARLQNQALAQELREANRQIQAYATQLEQLAVARERNRLARDLHDAVTQTVFSMTLTTKSALLLLERDPAQVRSQLDRLSQLAQSALAEMQLLISELRPEEAGGGLAGALRQHLAERYLPESLSISLEVEGDQPLEIAEEQGLLRITQEALNNIVKHAQASQARIRLHLTEPCWMEIEDQGRGFDLQQVQRSDRVGLPGMRERAAEIGWDLQIRTSPGAGTRIRVEKSDTRKGQG